MKRVSSLANLGGFLFDDGAKTTGIDDINSQVFLKTRHSGNDRLIRYGVLLSLSAIIATGGIILNSTATVIGAMIVAPLATPIQGIGLAIVTVRTPQILRSTLIVVVSMAAVIMLGWAINVLLPGTIDLVANGQITGRTAPTLLDLFVAIATGLVGAYATARSDLSGVLPGVAIAISLVPPLAVAGICFSQDAWSDGVQAILLFAANAIAIVICAMFVFWLAGYAQAARNERTEVRRSLIAVTAILLALIVALAATSLRSFARAVELARVENTATQWLKGSSYSYLYATYSGDVIYVYVIGDGELPDLGPFKEAYDPVLWFKPDIRLRILSGREADSESLIRGE